MRLVVVSFLCLTAGPAFAQEDFCLEMGGIARTIMDMRQTGVPIDRSIKSIGAIKPPTEEIGATVRAMIVDAYDEPRYSTPAMQDRAVTEFANRTTVDCLKGD